MTAMTFNGRQWLLEHTLLPFRAWHGVFVDPTSILFSRTGRGAVLVHMTPDLLFYLTYADLQERERVGLAVRQHLLKSTAILGSSRSQRKKTLRLGVRLAGLRSLPPAWPRDRPPVWSVAI